METLLYLYGYYLDNEVSCRKRKQLRVLKNYVGDKSTLLCGSAGINTSGIKLSTNNGFPSCLRTAVVENEGNDLSGFCHADYKFSTFVEKFMVDCTFDPIASYGENTKQLRLRLLRQLTKNKKSVATEPNTAKKRSATEMLAHKVAECFRDHFNPKKGCTIMTLDEKFSLLSGLEKVAAQRGTSIIREVRLNKEVVEDLMLETKEKNRALGDFWDKIEMRGNKGKSMAPNSMGCPGADYGKQNCEKNKQESGEGTNEGSKSR